MDLDRQNKNALQWIVMDIAPFALEDALI